MEAQEASLRPSEKQNVDVNEINTQNDSIYVHERPQGIGTEANASVEIPATDHAPVIEKEQENRFETHNTDTVQPSAVHHEETQGSTELPGHSNPVMPALSPSDEQRDIINEHAKNSSAQETTRGTTQGEKHEITINAPEGNTNMSQGEKEKQDAAATAEPELDAMPSDDVLMKRLREVLNEVDLNVTSEKMIRKKLEAEFGVGLSSRKTMIRSGIEEYLKSHHNGDDGGDQVEEAEAGDDSQRAAPKRRHGYGSVLSAPMAAFLGMDSCPRTQVVKKLWEYIKEHNLQDPANRRMILLDDKLKTLFPGKSVNMFSMQKHLSKHVFVDDSYDDEDHGNSVRQPAKRRKTSQTKSTSARSRRAKNSGDGVPRPSGFTKPCKLSPELAEFMGSETAARHELSKKLWQHVKERDLQDPSNRQYILSDDVLLKLTGEKRFQGFSFGKLIKDHILGYVD